MSRSGKKVDYLLVRNINKKFSEGHRTEKRAAKEHYDKKKSPYIHGQVTRDNYAKTCKAFGKWCERTYHVSGNLSAARQHAGEWLGMQENPNTRKAYAAALAKGFNCNTSDFGVELGKRHLSDVERGRNLSPRSKAWRENHAEVAEALRCCGLRVDEARDLRGSDVFQDKSGAWFVHVESGKGGLERSARVWVADGAYTGLDWLRASAERVGPSGRVFDGVPDLQNANVHALRAEYSCRMYDYYVSAGVHSEDGAVYRPRNSGVELDLAVVSAVNHDLGHGDDRASTLWYNYLSYGKG